MISKSSLKPDPVVQFQEWFDEAVKRNIEKADAFSLATATKNGVPSVRIMLFKGFNEKGLRFFTNFESAKGNVIKENPRCAILFFWGPIDRQVRIDGVVERLSAKEEDKYWASRPRGSQIGAYASTQSREIANREYLEQRCVEVEKKFSGRDIPRPEFWGGFVLIPERFEFWEGLPNRLHDRIIYTRSGKTWKKTRLAP